MNQAHIIGKKKNRLARLQRRIKEVEAIDRKELMSARVKALNFEMNNQKAV